MAAQDKLQKAKKSTYRTIFGFSDTTPIGGRMLITSGVDGQRIKAKIRFSKELENVKNVWLGFPPDRIIVFEPREDSRI